MIFNERSDKCEIITVKTHLGEHMHPGDIYYGKKLY